MLLTVTAILQPGKDEKPIYQGWLEKKKKKIERAWSVNDPTEKMNQSQLLGISRLLDMRTVSPFVLATVPEFFCYLQLKAFLVTKEIIALVLKPNSSITSSPTPPKKKPKKLKYSKWLLKSCFLICKMRNKNQNNHCHLFKINKTVCIFEIIKNRYFELLPDLFWSLSWPHAESLDYILSFNLSTIL